MLSHKFLQFVFPFPVAKGGQIPLQYTRKISGQEYVSRRGEASRARSNQGLSLGDVLCVLSCQSVEWSVPSAFFFFKVEVRFAFQKITLVAHDEHGAAHR